MNDEQKKIIENIHNDIEELMLEKAKITLELRKDIIEGNTLNNSKLENLRKIDEQILVVYRKEVDRIKKHAKKLREAARKEYGQEKLSQDKQFEYYGNGYDRIVLQSSFAANKLYGDKTRIDSADIQLYNNLLEEMYQVQQEQNKLWNHTYKNKMSMTNLEKMFKNNIINMQKVMPTLRSKLGFEAAYLNDNIEKKQEKIEKLNDSIQEKEARHGSQRNKRLGTEKKERNKLVQETKELNKDLNTTESIYNETLKSQSEMEKEATQRQNELQELYKQKRELEKKERREANEARHQANLQKQQAKITSPPKEEQIISIEKPKNKKKFKDKLKKVLVAVVAAAILATGVVTSFANEKNNKNHKVPSQSFDNPPQVTMYENKETKDADAIISEIEEKIEETAEVTLGSEIEYDQEKLEEKIKDTQLTVEQDTITYENDISLEDEVYIGNNIYKDQNSAINKENALTPYFDENKTYTVIGVTYQKDGDSKTLYTSTENYLEIENMLKQEGYKSSEYLITTQNINDIDFSKIENVQKYATGHVSADEVTAIKNEINKSR